MNDRCQPGPAQVLAASFGASYDGHYCTSWHAWTCPSGSRVIWCMHEVAIELGVAT